MTGSDAVVIDDYGRRSLYVGPQVPEAAPPVVREGLVRRRLVALGQPCPCGAVLAVPNRAARREARRAGRALHVNVEHEADCAAISPVVDGYLTAGGWAL